jgi:non-homologous end joining protein Ku
MAVKTTNIILAGTTVIPVKLDKATESGTDVKLNRCSPEGNAVKQTYRDEVTGQVYETSELPKDRLYDGHLIGGDDLAEIDAECKIEDLEASIVPISSIPWHYAKGTYYIYPDPKASAAVKGIFHAFMEAAQKEKRALLCKWTPRSRQSALAITFDGEKAVAVEIAFAGDVRKPSDNAVEFAAEKPVKAVVDKVREVLVALTDENAYDGLKDEAVEKRRSLVEKVASGEKVVSTKPARKAADTATAVDSVIADLDAALAAKAKS